MKLIIETSVRAHLKAWMLSLQIMNYFFSKSIMAPKKSIMAAKMMKIDYKMANSLHSVGLTAWYAVKLGQDYNPNTFTEYFY